MTKKEYASAYQKIYFQKNKEILYEKRREYIKTNHEKIKPKRLIRAKRYQDKRKLQLFDLLGGPICVECGCNIIKALEVNHINGGGCQETKGGLYRDYSSRYNELIKNPKRIKEFNILCRICNAHHYLRDVRKVTGGKFIVTFQKDEELGQNQ